MQDNKLTVPIAIIVAGALIGAAVIFTQKTPAEKTPTDETTVVSKTINIKPVSSSDSILGDPNAKILIVEYSDTECPYCKDFAVTMKKIVDTYGKNSTVAWVYRHNPIAGLHPLAVKESEATECVKQIAGNDVFWKYLLKIYEVSPGNNRLDPAQLPILAADLGVNKTSFQACLDSGEFTQKIQDDIKEAAAAGSRGTPYSVMIPKTPLRDITIKQINKIFETASLSYKVPPDQLGYITTDKKVVLNGALPYELIQQIIAAIVS